MTLRQARLLIIHLVCTDQVEAAEELAAEVRQTIKKKKTKKVQAA